MPCHIAEGIERAVAYAGDLLSNERSTEGTPPVCMYGCIAPPLRLGIDGLIRPCQDTRKWFKLRSTSSNPPQPSEW